MRSVTFAEDVRREEERLLIAAVEDARKRRDAVATAVSLGIVCDMYREHQKEAGKRFDRDQYRIDVIEDFFGRARDVKTVDLEAADTLVSHLRLQRGVGSATIQRYLTTLIAMLNFAKSRRKIAHHELEGMKREKQKKRSRPKTFSRRQVAILLGPAMERYEREQIEEYDRLVATSGRNRVRQGSVLPLRGICLIAYRTLMRPDNNLSLRWEQLHIDRQARTGWYELPEHKNASKGVEVRAPIAPSLVAYLLTIMVSDKPSGYVHPNARTGEPYVNIRRQWDRLVEIANAMLPDDEQIKDQVFYNWRHTGASELAATGADPVMITRMMGDTSLATVMEHYFDSSLEHMQLIVARWDQPETVPLTSIN
jgi:integrase